MREDAVVTDIDESNRSRRTTDMLLLHPHAFSGFDRRTWRSVQSSPSRNKTHPQWPLRPRWIWLRLAPTAKMRWWTEKPFIRGRAMQKSSAHLPAFWIFTKWNKLRTPATSAFSESYSWLYIFFIFKYCIHWADLIPPPSLRAITKPQGVLQAPVDTEETMKDFCNQACLSSFNYKRITSAKIHIKPVASRSQCSVCSRYCIVRDKGTHFFFFIVAYISFFFLNVVRKHYSGKFL